MLIIWVIDNMGLLQNLNLNHSAIITIKQNLTMREINIRKNILRKTTSCRLKIRAFKNKIKILR